MSFIAKVLAAPYTPPTITPPAIGPGGSAAGSTTSIFNIFPQLLPKILNWFSIAGGIIAFTLIIWYGTQYIMAGGSPEKAKSARTALLNVLTGIAVVAGVYALVNLGFIIAQAISTIIS